jgi:hypothetical protein
MIDGKYECFYLKSTKETQALHITSCQQWQLAYVNKQFK